MLRSRSLTGRAAAFCLPLALGSLPTVALAQDDAPADAPKSDDKPAPAEEEPEGEDAEAGDAETAPAAPAVTSDASEKGDARNTETERETGGSETQAGAAVERLPASAFPEPTVRGIHGGSLWLTFHGLQWPYMPQIGAEPDTRLGFSGSVWIDTSFRTAESNVETTPSVKQWIQEGRFVLRGTPTYSNGDWFVQGQGELVASKEQTLAPRVDADDVWIRAGKWSSWDVQAGRFEAWEVYHLGMGLDLNTFERRGAVLGNDIAPGLYGATFMFDRPADTGNIAAHLYPTDFLRFELLANLGNGGGLNTIGARPAGIFDIGWLKVKAAAEYRLQTWESDISDQEIESRGVGGQVQLVFDPYVELGGGGGYGLVDFIDEAGNINEFRTDDRYTAGGFVNGRIVPNLLAGAGVHYTKVSDTHQDPSGRVGTFDHLQGFVALQYLALDQLFTKLVFGYADAHFNPSYDNPADMTMNPPRTVKSLSARLRFMYLF